MHLHHFHMHLHMHLHLNLHLRYGAAVTALLSAMSKGEEVEQHSRYILERMWGVQAGADCLTKHTARTPTDAAALCHLSVLQERLGLTRSALAAIELARAQVTEVGERDAVRANMGRLLVALGRPEEAVGELVRMEAPTLASTCCLALAHYRGGDLAAAYAAYSSCLAGLAEDQGTKSHLLVAMGSLAYKVEGVAAAKTLLFQSCQLSPPSVRGLLALAVIGVQHSDVTLIDAALSELVPHNHDRQLAPDIAFLRASVLVLKGDAAGARRSLLAAVHAQPWMAGMWAKLAVFLLQNCPRDAAAAAGMATKAGRMEQSGGRGVGVEERGRTATSAFLPALALLMAGDTAGALRRAQAAVHLHPQSAECWAVLAAAGLHRAPALPWLPGALAKVASLPGASRGLREWAARV